MGSGQATSPEEHFVAEAFRETVVGGDVDSLTEYFSDRLDYYSSSGDLGGRAELESDVETFHTAFPDLDGRIKKIMSQGGKVSFLYELTGTHDGEFEGVPPTGESMTAKGAAIVKVDDVITEYRIVFDNLGMLEQLGIVDD